ncbi:response regulator [Thalassotalea euphylliae]|uniref:Response regulator n=1 Tax=Thalassotalea euphylliae TaxID=1655234 RepID=A0A3E0TUE7_9GAMM|nr:SpoIIE family protein phosphatase [Thalassotalea euphylliae]REL28013.1 response regulator [Thalassotalea euphylliae]
MPQIVLLTLTRPASLDEIKTLRDATAKVLAKLGIDGAQINKVKLAISEWTTNIVKHAKHPASFVKLVISQIKNIEGNEAQPSLEQRIVISIEDNSTYFQAFSEHQAQMTGEMPSAAQLESSTQTKSTDQITLSFGESGMGLGIIFKLFADCAYQQKISTAALGDQITNVFTFSLPYQATQRKTVHVAIVEDEPMMRELIKGYLPAHYEVTMFADGLAFLAAFQQDSPSSAAALSPIPAFDLVISDIAMPNLDGLALKKRLADHPHLAQVPFIFLTAQDDFDVEMQANHLGIDNYLLKPIQKAKLRLSVERALIRHQQLEAERADTLNRSLDNALNQSLKPQVNNTIDGYQAGVRSISPMTGGGDFIYQQAIGDKTLLILADVMGHDAQAKLFAHSFSGFFAGFFSGLAQNQQNTYQQTASFALTEMMAALSNKLFEDELLSTSMFTYVALLIDKQGVEVACAGHPPPVLMSNQNARHKNNHDTSKHESMYAVLNVGGALAGVCPDLSYQSSYVPMQTGEQLVLFTDGLTDCLPDGMTPNALFAQFAIIKQQYSRLDEVMEHSFGYFQSLCLAFDDDVTLLMLAKI